MIPKIFSMIPEGKNPFAKDRFLLEVFEIQIRT